MPLPKRMSFDTSAHHFWDVPFDYHSLRAEEGRVSSVEKTACFISVVSKKNGAQSRANDIGSVTRANGTF